MEVSLGAKEGQNSVSSESNLQEEEFCGLCLGLNVAASSMELIFCLVGLVCQLANLVCF